MIDSTNPRIMADNIRHLAEASGFQASEISELQITVEALGSYSATEVNTGMKYGDSDIYRIVFTGKTPVSGSLQLSLTYNEILALGGTVKATNGVVYDFNKTISLTTGSGNTLSMYASTNTIFQDADYIVAIEYTKPAPASLNSPAPDDTRSIEPEVREEVPEEEPVQEVKKTTRKKSTN